MVESIQPASPARAPRALPRPDALSLCPVGHPERARLERLVSRVYARVHGANLRHFHANLLGLKDAEGGQVGVIGCTAAEAGPLFLETYLDLPVEQALARAVGQPVARRDLAEVGNLAGGCPRSAPALVSTLARALHSDRRRWAVFTATASLRRCFKRLGVSLTEIIAADGARLGEEQAQWGRYYDGDPRVVAVHIPGLCSTTAACPELSDTLSALWAGAASLILGHGTQT
jgi:hypothetical protein